MKGNNQKSKQFKKGVPNPLEALKDIGQSTAEQMRNDAANISADAFDALFGINTRGKKLSGEISVGETVEINKTESTNNNRVIDKQIYFQRQLLDEERKLFEKKSAELKLRLKVIQDEMIIIADKTNQLAQETKIAATQVSIDPGLYHVFFFEKLFEFINSFRKNIESATTWLHSINKRATKKNAWGSNYKKYGAKYLLSGEHYLSRSAG